MSRVGLDQLFQITAPVRSLSENAPRNDASGEPFRAHLEQASTTTEVERSEPNEDSRDIEEEPSIESQADQQETVTTQQEEAASAEESVEASAEVAETEQPSAQIEDDVTLSTAAVTAVVETVNQDQAENNEAGVNAASEAEGDASNSGGQRQAAGSPNIDAVAPTEGDANTESTISATINSTELAEEGGEAGGGESAELQESFSAEGEAATARDQQAIEATEQSQNARQVESIAGDNTSDVQSQATVQVVQEQQGVADGAEEKVSRDQKRSSTEVARAVTSVAATDAELLPESNATATEATPSAPTTPAAGNEFALTTDRSLGRPVSNGTTSSANENREIDSSNTPRVDRARFVQRVGGAIRSAQQRDGQIQLRLSPPELGTLKIEIAVNNGLVTAKLETENAAARTVLLDNLPALRERLAEQEIRIEKFDVDVRRDGQQSENPGAEDRQTDQRRQQVGSGREGQSVGQQSTVAQTKTTTSLPVNDSGLDVRI